jgi:hypothetical protein
MINLFGVTVNYSKATTPNEPYWSNTIHGNRHLRILSIEKVFSEDGLVIFTLYAGSHQINFMKNKQIPHV